MIVLLYYCSREDFSNNSCWKMKLELKLEMKLEMFHVAQAFFNVKKLTWH